MCEVFIVCQKCASFTRDSTCAFAFPGTPAHAQTHRGEDERDSFEFAVAGVELSPGLLQPHPHPPPRRVYRGTSLTSPHRECSAGFVLLDPRLLETLPHRLFGLARSSLPAADTPAPGGSTSSACGRCRSCSRVLFSGLCLDGLKKEECCTYSYSRTYLN